MLGSSIKLSLLSRRTSKVQLRGIQSQQNRAKTAVLTRAVHIQHVIASKQPIEIKRKRASKYSTAEIYRILIRYNLIGQSYELNSI